MENNEPRSSIDAVLILPPHQAGGVDYPNPVTREFRLAPHPPLGILSLASYLKNKKPRSRIKIIDGQFSTIRQILKEIEVARPKIVGISPLVYTYQNALEIARFSKSLGACVVFGGNYATGLYREVLHNRGPNSKNYCVDVIIQQDGEGAMLDLLQGKPIKEIANCIFQKKSAIVKNRVKLLNLNDLPRIDFDLIDLNQYWSKIDKMIFPRLLPMQSRRGCGWRAATRSGCLFCSLTGKELRFRQPEIFADDLIYYQNKYQPEFIWDVSDDFFDSRAWLEEYLRRMDGRQTPRFIIYSRTDRISRESFPIVQKLKIGTIIFGFESASSSMLKKMNKPCRNRDNERAMKVLRGSGVKAVNCVVIGNLRETPATLKETLKAARAIKRKNPDVLFAPFFLRPWPNSLARELLIKKTGLKYRGRDIFDSDEMFRDWLKYFTRINYKLASRVHSELIEL